MRRGRPATAVARRAFADGRVRTLAFGYLFAAVAYASVAGYRSTYPTLRDRLGLERAFGPNKAVRLFYGTPHDLASVGGFSAWRVGGLLSIFAAAWGLLAAVRALRVEEDAGRQELVLAGTVSRRSAYLAALAAILAGAAVLWLALFAGLALARLPAGPAAYLALATVSPLPVLAGVGAVASQAAPTRRLALELSGAALALALLLRVVADTAPRAGWLRWATPLGWAEELRPFAGARPEVLALPLAAGAALLAAAAAIAARRDVGSGILRVTDSRAPRLRLLGSPAAQALRTEAASLTTWVVATGAFAFVVGVISNSVSSIGISGSLRRQLRKLGDVAITTPAGYIGFTFLFFVLAVSLFACSQVASARHEEAGERLETLFALPLGRRHWLAGRLLLAVAGAAAVALAAGALAWAGAASQHAGVSLPRMLEAGVNCLPAALLFLALGALAFAVVPRATAGLAYGLVGVAFVWELVGGLVGAPAWLLGLSPFHHVGLVPAQGLRAGDAGIMLAIAAVAAAAAVWLFARRDLAGA
jgi:ABC-2 type transport system permease protein